MIRHLSLVFLAMAAYGMLFGYPGGGLIAMFMSGFMYWADKFFEAQDTAWEQNPRNAKAAQPPTSDALVEHECECMCDRL